MDNSAQSPFPDSGVDDHSLVAHIESTASKQGDAAYRQAILHLVGSEFDDTASRHYWQGAMEHWRGFAMAQEDSPGLRTVLFDYLHRVVGIIKNPCVVEAEYLDNLRQSSITDGLTGLYNQTHFKACLNRLLDRTRQRGPADGADGAVLLLDLDRFKQYNDRCGHLAGDEALRQAGKLIKASLRPGDLASRYGGEEFIILLPDVDQMEALAAAERIRNAFEGEHFKGEELLDSGKLTISGGIALYPGNGLTATDLIDHADRELYQAKRRRNTISPVTNDRQRAPRHNIRSIVEILPPGWQQYIPALTFDISAIGIKIGCEKLDESVETLSMRFRRPFWPVDLELEGQLCWSRSRDTGGMLFMGLEFQGGKDDAQGLLPVAQEFSGTRRPVGKSAKPFPWMNG